MLQVSKMQNGVCKMCRDPIERKECVVLFADLQQGFIRLSRTVSINQLRKGVRGLAKLAMVYGLPVIVLAIADEDGGAANIAPEIEEGCGAYVIHHRTSTNALLNEATLAAIQRTGRRTILMSGVATELAVQLPATTTAAHRTRVLVVMDAYGGMCERTERAALARIAQAGATRTCVMTFAGELAGDFRQPMAQAAIGIVFEMAGGSASDTACTVRF